MVVVVVVVVVMVIMVVVMVVVVVVVAASVHEGVVPNPLQFKAKVQGLRYSQRNAKSMV